MVRVSKRFLPGEINVPQRGEARKKQIQEEAHQGPRAISSECQKCPSVQSKDLGPKPKAWKRWRQTGSRREREFIKPTVLLRSR